MAWADKAEGSKVEEVSDQAKTALRRTHRPDKDFSRRQDLVVGKANKVAFRATWKALVHSK